MGRKMAEKEAATWYPGVGFEGKDSADAGVVDSPLEGPLVRLHSQLKGVSTEDLFDELHHRADKILFGYTEHRLNRLVIMASLNNWKKHLPGWFLEWRGTDNSQ
jgi:hypothetical protein